jgi:hypothetical protein
MAELQEGWRTMPVKNPAPSSILRLKADQGNYYRPSSNAGEKRFHFDDGRSVASKISRLTYTTQRTHRNIGRQATTSNITSIPRDDYFKSGTIILADHFEEAYNSGSVLTNNKSIIQVPGQKDICKKGRFFIVLAAHAESYISLPVYTHNGNGTRFKPKPEEYISIRDHRNAVEAPSQSVHNPLVTAEMSGSLLMTTSVAHLTYPIARKYITPVRVMGRLTVSSTNQLIQLFKRYMPVEVPESTTAPSAQGSCNDVLIGPDMTIQKALINLRFHKYSANFKDISWFKAAALSDSALIAIGVKGPDERKKLSSFFEKVKIARRAGPTWKLAVDPDCFVSA